MFIIDPRFVEEAQRIKDALSTDRAKHISVRTDLKMVAFLLELEGYEVTHYYDTRGDEGTCPCCRDDEHWMIHLPRERQ